MGRVDLNKARNVVVNSGKKIIEGFNHTQFKMSSITKDQVKEIEEKREEYYAKLDSIEDIEEADSVARTKMNEYAMDIYRAYLSEMSVKYLPIRSNEKISDEDRIRFFDITKWVVDSDEKDIDKLINVYQVLSQQECNIALIYRRNCDECRVTLAVANIGENSSPDIVDQFIERIQNSIKGNFPSAIMTESKAGSPLKTFIEKDNEKFFL